MSLGVLNNIAAIYAENNLNTTQNSLQTTLQQLSSGSRINSGADDAAGLSLADGLLANSAALNQSSINAQQGVGLLQVADGALSQVNSLLTRAVTLATEASNGTLDSNQITAANQEYQSILAEISNIGSTTTFNGSKVFSNGAVPIYTGDGTLQGSSTDTLDIATLSSAQIGDAGGTISATGAGGYYQSVKEDPTGTFGSATAFLGFQQGTGGTLVKVAIAAGSTVANIAADINGADISGVSASVVSDGSADGDVYLQINDAAQNLQNFTGVNPANASLVTAGTASYLDFTATATSAGGIAYTPGTGGSGVAYENLSTTNLTTTPSTTLADIDLAIGDVAAQRGYIGSQVNTLNAAGNVETTESTNITSAENGITATDYGAASSNLSKFEILSQAGISALAQANSAQQEVLKLLQ